ncbi:MAG TPA: zinc ribbon domain-containing protein [Anaerolineales bacterium]|nr:zinc ribbon domain-containing protein [Anaerolineales bacterium]
MDISAVFFLLAVLIIVGMYLYAPFTQRTRRVTTVEEQEISSLMAERDRVINALQELDFDFSLGKIPAEDYPAQRTELLKKGADILRKLDSIQPASSFGPDVEARIEEAIAARRADASAAVKAEVSDDDLESLIASRRKVRKERSAGFCPRCGQAVLVSDRFCPSCGKSLT